jgi:hypothetical protein
MNINYSKVAEQDIPMYEKAMVNALAYMKYKYPTLCYCGLNVELHSCDGGSHFNPYHKKGWKIKIHNRFKLYLYGRKSCGLTTPRGGIEVSAYVDAVITIIHELTHYAQAVYGEINGNKLFDYKFGTFSEIDTTKNSIEYLKEFHPDIHAKLIKTETDYPVPTYLEKLFSKINTDKIIQSLKPKEEKLMVKSSAPIITFSSMREAKQVSKNVKEVINDFVKSDKDKEKLEKLVAKKKEWESKQKRAENAIKKLNKKIKYYQNKSKKV